ncbi:MAG: DUF5060 domain-containing protein [Acidobacteriota bacterium]
MISKDPRSASDVSTRRGSAGPVALRRLSAALALPLLVGAASLLIAPAAAVAQGEVVSFTLIDAASNQPIAAHDPLVNGAVLDLDLLATPLSVRANVSASVGSVGFELSGTESHATVESVSPYALFGDTGGNYNEWSPLPGSYQLTARSFTESGGGGTAGSDFTIGFTVENDGPPLPDDGDGSVTVTGGSAETPDAPRRWHRVTLSLSGLGAVETSIPNPFLDLRFQVRFTGPSGQVFDVPGYFAGDGEGGASGNVWRAHLAPDEVGSWSYAVSFRQGSEVAVALTGAEGTAVTPFDGASGSFTVEPSQRTAPDMRAPGRGLIKNRGGHYLSEADGDPWVKGGPDIPENFLGYEGFDNTPDAGHTFSAHLADWRVGDPDWDGGAGRAIIGALNYIADRGANVIYFLPMNLFGDGRDTFPTIAEGEKTRYDLSKLAQWEIFFTHAQSRGIFLHFVLAETESGNENYHDNGNLGPERKLFYRMLNALFGHHNGLEWNLGEENDYGTAKHREFASYLKSVDPYDHPVTTHTKGGQYEGFYAPLLGNGDFDITSFQGGNSRTAMFDLIQDWRERSAAAGEPWAISFDEPQKIENDVNDVQNGYPHGRRDKMWPAYAAGAAGFEWYVQQDGGGHSFDQQIDDFSLMDEALRWTGHAVTFLPTLPLEQMSPDRSLVDSSAAGQVYALAKPGEVYLIFHDRAGGPLSLDLEGVPASETFDVLWFDPRQGGALQVGSVATVQGGDAATDLGSSPHTQDDDWVCLVLAQAPPLFADTFESGNLSAWSSSEP